MLVAAEVALLIHLVAFALIPGQQAPPRAERVVSEVVTIVRHTPAPTPKPTPAPTPRVVPTPRRTPAPHYTLAPKIEVRDPGPRMAAQPRHRTGGAAAHKRPVPATAPPVVAAPKPVVVMRRAARTVAVSAPAAASVVEGTHAGQQNGGAGTGAGAGVGDGGAGGTGTGTAGTGNGTGGESNTAPCGDVELIPGPATYKPDGTVLQPVQAELTLRDGTTQSARFPYPFVYKSDAENPFVHTEIGMADQGIPIQFPPAGAVLADMPVVIQAIITHSKPSTGTTKFPMCTPITQR